MRCPKCQFDHALQTTECLKCGIVFSRYRPAPEQDAQHDPPVEPADAEIPLAESALPIDRSDAIRELKYRALALPCALIVARLLAGTPLRIAAGMLAMVVHESGHAITAWLTGRWAIPLLWVTPHGLERSWFIVLLLAAAILFGGFVAWKAERWGWVCIAAVALLAQLIFLSLPAEATIVFGGDAGAMVLATFLMAAFYAPRESALHKAPGLRWGLLAIGALAFMHVFLLWTGPIDGIPFGEIEGVGPSDPTLLTEMYGWSVTQLVDRYVRLGELCLAAFAALYVWGLVSAYHAISSNSSSANRRAWSIGSASGPTQTT
jgi:hypothetical protein